MLPTGPAVATGCFRQRALRSLWAANAIVLASSRSPVSATAGKAAARPCTWARFVARVSAGANLRRLFDRQRRSSSPAPSSSLALLLVRACPLTELRAKRASEVPVGCYLPLGAGAGGVEPPRPSWIPILIDGVLIWSGGTGRGAIGNEFYRRAISQNSVCRTIRTPSSVTRTPMIRTRLALVRRRLW